MPEICEVVFTSQLLLSKFKNRFINKLNILSGKYLHGTMKGYELIAKYAPLKIKNIDTKGKFMWFELEGSNKKKIYMLSTFGLTGEWSFDCNLDEQNCRLKFDIDNGGKNDKKYVLYYIDDRNFGNFIITENVSDLNKKLDELGDDLLKVEFGNEEFEERIKRVNGDKKIVQILMDQTKKGIGSGIGNYLAPEILYHAKISPHREIKSLKKQEIHQLAYSIKYIIKLCYVHNDVGYMESFAKYVEEHKEKIENEKYPNYHPNVNVDGKEFKFCVYRQKKDPLGNFVKADKIINGRTTYWAPKVQK